MHRIRTGVGASRAVQTRREKQTLRERDALKDRERERRKREWKHKSVHIFWEPHHILFSSTNIFGSIFSSRKPKKFLLL